MAKSKFDRNRADVGVNQQLVSRASIVNKKFARPIHDQPGNDGSRGGCERVTLIWTLLGTSEIGDF